MHPSRSEIEKMGDALLDTTDSYRDLRAQRDDLLAALERLLSVQEENYGPCLEVDAEHCEWCQARAVIAKATGK